MMKKAELAKYAAAQFQDDNNDPIGKAIYEAAKVHEAEREKAVSELFELALSAGADRDQAQKAANKSRDESNNAKSRAGAELYFYGFIEAAELLGVHVTRQDIQNCIDEENNRRTRTIMEWAKQKEKERLCREVDERFTAYA